MVARLYHVHEQQKQLLQLQQQSRDLESEMPQTNMEILIHKTGKEEQAKQTKQTCKRNTIALLLMILLFLFGILLFGICFRCNIANFVVLFMFDIVVFIIVCLNGKEIDNHDI